MGQKIGAARREAYFRALGETGNQGIAAERARVSLGWAKRQRRIDPAFDARLKATVAQARERLRSGPGGMRPPAGWGSLDGEELVVRAGNGRSVQIVRAGLRRWTPRLEARFLATLAATCNVTASAKAVGLSAASAYYHAQRWPDFAARWQSAIEEGYVRIELELMVRTTRSLSPEPDQLAMSDEAGLHQLYMHRHALHGVGKAPGRRADPLRDGREAMLRVLLRNIERIERRKASGVVVSDQQRARDRREWTRRGAV